MTTNLNIFQAGTAGINFAAYCAMVNAEVDLMVTQREQLYKGMTDSEGNEVGLNYLSALQTKTAAEAVKQSGIDQANATMVEGISQMVGGAASAAIVVGTTYSANNIKPGTDNTTGTFAKNGVNGKSLPNSGAPDEKDLQDKIEDTAKKTDKSSIDSATAQATTKQQMGHTIANSVSALSSGAGATYSSTYKRDAAHEDEKRVFAEGVREQISNTLQQLTAAIQSAEQREQMALQTQAAIVSATSRA